MIPPRSAVSVKTVQLLKSNENWKLPFSSDNTSFSKDTQRYLLSVYREVGGFFLLFFFLLYSSLSGLKKGLKLKFPIHDGPFSTLSMISVSPFTLCANLHSLTSYVPTHPVQ